MNVLLIGNASGRLNCLARSLHNTNRVVALHIVTNHTNDDLAAYGKVHEGDPCDWLLISEISSKIEFELAIISDEAQLAAGLADQLIDDGIPTVGPTEKLARIETSKKFCRELLDRHDIPGNPTWRSFSAENSVSHIDTWIEALGEVAIKPVGLTGGKGVWVSGDHFNTRSEGVEYARQVLKTGQEVIVEARLDGEEFSLMSLTDGQTVIDCPPVQDCKRLLNGDLGPNTGGMGSWSASHELPPWLSPEHLALASTTNRMVLEALQHETGEPYRGILYGNYIRTRHGINLIEFNARFGDSEVMNVLPLLVTDFVDTAEAMATGNLTPDMVRFRPGFSVVKYLVPAGHPNSGIKHFPVSLDTITAQPGLQIYRASLHNNRTTGSRTVAMLGIADTMATAEQIAEQACCEVKGPLIHRSDIGTAGLFKARQKRLERLLSA